MEREICQNTLKIEENSGSLDENYVKSHVVRVMWPKDLLGEYNVYTGLQVDERRALESQYIDEFSAKSHSEKLEVLDDLFGRGLFLPGDSNGFQHLLFSPDSTYPKIVKALREHLELILPQNLSPEAKGIIYDILFVKNNLPTLNGMNYNVDFDAAIWINTEIFRLGGEGVGNLLRERLNGFGLSNDEVTQIINIISPENLMIGLEFDAMASDLLLEAFKESLTVASELPEFIDATVYVISSYSEIYVDIVAELYIEFSELLLSRVTDTQRPVLFLFRDGEFLKKSVKLVAKRKGIELQDNIFKDAYLSRSVFKKVDNLTEDIRRAAREIYQNIKVEDGLPENIQLLIHKIQKNEDEIRRLDTENMASSIRIREELREANDLLLDDLAHILAANPLNNIDRKILDSISGIRRVTEIRDQKRVVLDEYLDSLGCFNPFLDLADTGISGTIMNEIGLARERYWNQNIHEEDFLMMISESYGVERVMLNDSEFLDSIRRIYIGEAPLNENEGYVLRSYFVATGSKFGDSSNGYRPILNKNRGIIYAAMSQADVSRAQKMGIIPILPTRDRTGGIKALVYPIESRLNGYRKPILEIRKADDGSFYPIYENHIIDSLENKFYLDAFSNPDLSRNESIIDRTISRRLLNLTAMRLTLGGIRAKLTNSENIEANKDNRSLVSQWLARIPIVKQILAGGAKERNEKERLRRVAKIAEAFANIPDPLHRVLSNVYPTIEDIRGAVPNQ